MSAEPAETARRVEATERLPPRTKAVYALGDHTINLSLSSLSFFFPWFLTDVAGMRPWLAGLIPLLGRAVDAFTDPAMGRISDLTRWRAGRRRPYLLLGMLPFGAAYAALWWNVPAETESAKFAYYASAYVLYSIAVTVLAIPYLALIPEMTASYQERTSFNAYRAFAAISGTLLAVVTMRPLANVLGDGSQGFAAAGVVYGVWLVVPWILVYAVTFERPGYRRKSQVGFVAGVKLLARQHSYRRLTALFLLGRIAIDLTMAMMIYYFTYWIGRPGDFEITMGIFLVSVMIAFPAWLKVSAKMDKRSVFMWGASLWVLAQTCLVLAQPEWPRIVIFVVAALAGASYAAADMIPWSMLGEVVDEDELASGERREGVYFGFFTFLRKLGGASGVAIALFVLDVSGFVANQPQSEVTLWTIRLLTAALPGVFVLLAIFAARSYPLGRQRHAEILAELARRRHLASQ
jgi:glycoside/pentoside/hexuronide:cation symporter, GPH family